MFDDKSLVTSDIVAGLILLSQKEMREKVEKGGDGGSSLETVRLDWGLTKHFYNYAAASYGSMWWLLQTPLHACSHCCQLSSSLSFLSCCHCCRPTPPYEVQDGICRANLAAIRLMLELAEEDIVMFDNTNSIEEVPFLLVVDRTTRSLVISIRGTLSLHDMLTDLNAGRTRISEVKTDWEGHEGMVRAAQNLIRSDLSWLQQHLIFSFTLRPDTGDSTGPKLS